MQQWIEICDFERIAPDTGICALVGNQQVAVFRLARTGELYAIGNHDPFSGANVLSRGIVGDRNGVPKVASPVYKQSFCLRSGTCLDDPSITVPVFPVRCENGRVMIGLMLGP